MWQCPKWQAQKSMTHSTLCWSLRDESRWHRRPNLRSSPMKPIRSPMRRFPKGTDVDDPLAGLCRDATAGSLSNATWQAIQSRQSSCRRPVDGTWRFKRFPTSSTSTRWSWQRADLEPRSVCDRMTFQKPKPGSKPSNSVRSPGRLIRTERMTQRCEFTATKPKDPEDFSLRSE